MPRDVAEDSRMSAMAIAVTSAALLFGGVAVGAGAALALRSDTTTGADPRAPNLPTPVSIRRPQRTVSGSV
jgi:hypothetical protein